MILPTGTIVAVADGATFHLFRNKGAEPHVDLVALDEPDLATHNPGSGGRHRSSSANPDSDRSAEDGHAAAIAEYLNRLAIGEKVDAVFVIADPRTLGEMRRHFHASLVAKIVGELAKDLTGHSARDIAAAIHST